VRGYGYHNVSLGVPQATTCYCAAGSMHGFLKRCDATHNRDGLRGMVCLLMPVSLIF
jgi:hypothetical protein